MEQLRKNERKKNCNPWYIVSGSTKATTHCWTSLRHAHAVRFNLINNKGRHHDQFEEEEEERHEKYKKQNDNN